MRRVFEAGLVMIALLIGALGVFNIHVANETVRQCNEAQEKIKMTFLNQCNVNETQREIAVAQDYANNLSAVLQYETDRNQQLETRLQECADAFFVANENIRIANMRIEMSIGYINQLRQYITDNDLPVPTPDPNSWAPNMKEQAQEALRDD